MGQRCTAYGQTNDSADIFGTCQRCAGKCIRPVERWRLRIGDAASARIAWPRFWIRSGQGQYERSGVVRLYGVYEIIFRYVSRANLLPMFFQLYLYKFSRFQINHFKGDHDNKHMHHTYILCHGFINDKQKKKQKNLLENVLLTLFTAKTHLNKIQISFCRFLSCT